MNPPAAAVAQGTGSERMPMLDRAKMSEVQQQVADALIVGPRKGVKGPFVPLLRSPVLMDRMAKVGEYLRFDSVLPARLNEFTTSVVSRHVGNQFEWAIHHPLAIKAGVSADVIAQLAQGARPTSMAEDEALAYDLTMELLRTHGLSNYTYASALAAWGEQGVLELVSLIGYFCTVSWVMNVARTPALAAGESGPLDPFPI